MSVVDVDAVHRKGLLKRPTVILFLGFLSLFAQSVQATDNALKFYKSYFVTGDYVVGGVGLRGQGVRDTQTKTRTGTNMDYYATGTIAINGVPTNADVVAAYLYWMTIEGSEEPLANVGTFRDFRIVGHQIAPAGVNACWGSGGGALSA